MASSSPTSRTLAWCRGRGWTAQVVEKWIAQARRRIDLWGWIDVLVLDGLPGVLGIQATTTQNLPARVQKALETDHLVKFLTAGNRAEFWGWAQRGPRGKRKLWTLSRRIVHLEQGVPVVRKLNGEIM